MISFVIPAHNEAALLDATLAAVHAAAADRPHEVIVVDDASTDGTGGIARARGARVLRVEHRHIAATRNAGAAVARGDVLVFIDADTLVDAAVVSAALQALADGAVGGGAAVRLAGEVAWHEALTERLLIRVFRWLRIAPGCFVFCTRAAFAATPGFDEAYFAGEDVALSRALARVGRFVILRQPVRTSARKLRHHSIAEHLRLAALFLVRGRAILRSRQHLALWYGQRRNGRGPPRE